MADTWQWAPCDGQSVKLKVVDLGDGTFGYAAYVPASSSTHIAGAGTTVVKSGAGVLRSVIINKAIALGVITMYDNTTATGTVLGIITNPAVLLQSQVPIDYNVKFGTGLTVVTSAADDITVAYI
jgi:hypothetical protein